MAPRGGGVVTCGGRTPRGGAVIFWAASMSVGLAAFFVLAVLAHTAAAGELAAASAVISVSFVLAVFPGAIQLRAAASAAAADGAPAAGVPRRPIVGLTAALLVASPVIAAVLAVPTLAIALLALQLPTACWVSVQRGIAIGRADHTRASISMGADAACRLLAGIGLGIAFGATGLAAALLLGTLAAGLAGRRWYATSGDAPARDVVGPALTVGLLMVLCNLDAFAAPRILGAHAADAYAVAELPARGVFFALFAVSWLAVPIAARSHRRGQLLAPVGGVLTIGAAAALTLLVVRPLLSIALGDPPPAAGLLFTLTGAMSVGAALATALAMAVARRATAPWAACAAASAALAVAIVALHPASTELAALVLAAQVAALGGTTWSLLRTVAHPRSLGSDLATAESADVSRSSAHDAAASSAPLASASPAAPRTPLLAPR